MDQADFLDVELTLIAERFAPGAPTGRIRRIDREIAASAECDSCGHQGLNYRGFFREPGSEAGPLHMPVSEHARSYRAFVVCPACEHWAEI